uniref:Uncharacterized protein n=1 Tax=Penaeus semisulcatus majanivirus TaxID=2984274 RepID=A0A9C7BMF5_9VIRU|nr:MAG: hypothetical protein [Penaeus semisulcatus majanivirus]
MNRAIDFKCYTNLLNGVNSSVAENVRKVIDWVNCGLSHNCKVYIFPDEAKDWKDEEVTKITFDKDRVDRVYYFMGFMFDPVTFHIAFRTHYKSRLLYVEFFAFNIFWRNVETMLILTYNAQRFVDTAVRSLHKDRDTILQHMLDDRVNVCRSWRNISPLKQLCSRTITDQKIDFLSENIPRCIMDTLIEDEEISKIESDRARLIKEVYGIIRHCWLPGNYRVTHFAENHMWDDNSDDEPGEYYHHEHNRKIIDTFKREILETLNII